MSFIRVSRRHDYDVTGLCGVVLQTLRLLYRKGCCSIWKLAGQQIRTRASGSGQCGLPPHMEAPGGTGLNAYFPLLRAWRRSASRDACERLSCLSRRRLL
jgi:hypothetical protein